MNHLDDLFRDGLEGRRAEVPNDLWSKIAAGRAPIPEGEMLDREFADALQRRRADLPPGAWEAIAAARGHGPTDARLDHAFADALQSRTATPPAGTWEKIWAARTGRRPSRVGYWAVAALLLIGFATAEMVHFATATDYALPPVERPFVVADAEYDRSDAATGTLSNPLNSGAEEEKSATNEWTTDLTLPTTVSSSSPPNSPSSAIDEVANDGVNSFGANDKTPPRTEDNSEQPGNIATAGVPLEVATTTLPAARAPFETALTEALRFTAPSNLPTTLPELDFKPRDIHPGRESGDVFRAAPGSRTQTEMLFGVSYANQRLGVGGGADAALRDERFISEFPELSYQITLRQSRRLGQRWQASAGLTYAEIRNRVEYEDVVNGERVLAKRNNQIRMLELPLLAGYRVNGSRVRVAVNAGPVINLFTGVSGLYLHPDFNAPLPLGESGFYRRNVGVGFMASLSTTYVIGRKQPFLLLLEPYFKHYPTSFTVPGAPVREDYWVAGLQVGVRRSF